MVALKPGKEWVAFTLAIGMATALNVFTGAVLWDALFNEAPGLSENGTQVLTGWGGGIVGVLGAYVGYRAGASDGAQKGPGAAAGGAAAPGPGEGLSGPQSGAQASSE